MSAPSAPPDGVSFTATLTGRNGAIEVSYQVVNDGTEPIVVFNGVPTVDSPNPAPAVPEAFYVIPRGGTAVRLTKQVYGLPEGVTVYAPSAIRGTVVPPGERAGERVTLTGEVRPRRPYQDVLGYSDLKPPSSVRTVELCIGVAPADKVRPRDDSDPEHPGYGHDTATANQQYVFCSGPHPLGV